MTKSEAQKLYDKDQVNVRSFPIRLSLKANVKNGNSPNDTISLGLISQ